jgi:transcriptional regulator with XRE-family HTH domain
MTDLSNFGHLIREKRKEKGFTLNYVAQELNIDTSTLCKIEKSERTASKEIVVKIAKVLDLDKDRLLVSFFSDKVAFEIWREENASNVLKVAEEKVTYLKSTNIKQSKINF